MKIAIAGGTGFVGTRLVERLHSQGDTILLLSRHAAKARRQFPSDLFPRVEVAAYTPTQAGDWYQAISGCDGVVNLAGEPIVAGRWTAARKQAIRDSRRLTTQRLVEAIAAAAVRPKVLVNGSAIGAYGTSETKEFDEYSYTGSDFLAQACKDWEAAADEATPLGVRVVKLRAGIVLGYGGALARLLPLFQLGLGGAIGTGKQWFSWIHRDDLARLIAFALHDSRIVGVLNGTAPHPVTNAEFTQALAQAVGRPAFLPVPAAALQIAFGEAAVVVVEGQKVLPQKALLNGFVFRYPRIEEALAQILA